MNFGWDGMGWERRREDGMRWEGRREERREEVRRREEKKGRYGRVVIMGQNKHYSSMTY